MARLGKYYTADFETTTDINDCRVWSWAVFEIGSKDCFEYGTDIQSFMKFCANPKKNYTLAFHNLKFDAQFILYYLLTNGYEHIDDKKDARDKTFTTLITDMGQYYSIEVYFKKRKGGRVNKVRFIDSLKLLNFSVSDIAKSFDLPIQKLEMDYEKEREIGYQPTTDELSYIRNDVEIMARALDIMYKQGHTRLTISSNALEDYKQRTPNFRTLFPTLSEECDSDIRQAYKGGFSYVNPVCAEKKWGKGIVFDVNSLYPSILRGSNGELMPYGKPVFFEGKYIRDPYYPFYVQKFRCRFRIKDGKIPSIQIKHTASFMPNEYIEDGNWEKDEPITLTLCSIDMELFREQYHIKDIEYLGGWKLKAKKGMFNSYVDYWMKEKVESKKKGLKAQTQIAKLFLNSLYGRFSTSPNASVKIPVLEGDVVHTHIKEGDKKSTVYIPVGVWTTAYGRAKTIRTSQAIRDWSIKKYDEDLYRYSDTDSIHICLKNKDEDLKDLSGIIDIDDYKLGWWKPESEFIAGKWLRAKCYIEQSEDGTINSTIAGLPKALSHLINFDNFKIGFTTADFTDEQIGRDGKKSFTYCKGGVVLTPTDFTIK